MVYLHPTATRRVLLRTSSIRRCKVSVLFFFPFQRCGLAIYLSKLSFLYELYVVAMGVGAPAASGELPDQNWMFVRWVCAEE